MARACSGMSGRDQASGAGDRSSVLVSPVTLKTVSFWRGTSGRLVNHFGVGPGLAHGLALALPTPLAFSSTSWKKSKTSRVFRRWRRAPQVPHGGNQQVDRGLDVEAAQHGAEQFGRLSLEISAGASSPLADGRPGTRLHLGGIIHARRHAVGDQFDQGGLFPAGRFFSKATSSAVCCLDSFGGDTWAATFGDVGAIGFKHGNFPFVEDDSRDQNILRHQNPELGSPPTGPEVLYVIYIL